MLTECTICKSPFIPKRKNAKTCSTECSLRHKANRHPTVEAECSECGSVFQVVQGGNRLTCSKQCAAQRKYRVDRAREQGRPAKPASDADLDKRAEEVWRRLCGSGQ